MNFLQIGLTAKQFEYPPGSLVICDEGTPKKGEKLYVPGDGLNPLPMTYPANRELAAALWPDKELMTYRNGKRALARMVVNADRIDRLQYRRGNDDDKEAKGVVEDILLSPLLREALLKPLPRWVLSGGTIIARLNRKEIGDDDANIIANILISQFKGQIVIEDFGAYARDHHAALIREERLIAGVYTLSELGEPKDKFRQRCMLMPKEGKGCTFEDAGVLAKYQGLVPSTNAYNDRLAVLMAAGGN